MAVGELRGKGQLTIPAELRNELGFETGDKLVMSAIDNRLVIERQSAVLDRLTGIFSGRGTPVPLDIDRDEIWAGIAEEREEYAAEDDDAQG